MNHMQPRWGSKLDGCKVLMLTAARSLKIVSERNNEEGGEVGWNVIGQDVEQERRKKPFSNFQRWISSCKTQHWSIRTSAIFKNVYQGDARRSSSFYAIQMRPDGNKPHCEDTQIIVITTNNSNSYQAIWHPRASCERRHAKDNAFCIWTLGLMASVKWRGGNKDASKRSGQTVSVITRRVNISHLWQH